MYSKIKFFFQNFISYQNFKNFNKETYLKKYHPKKKTKNILVEFNAFSFMHIILSTFLNVLRNNFNCNFYAYKSHVLLSYNIKENFLEKLKKNIALFLGIGTYGIYQSIGIKKFINYNINDEIKKKSLLEKKKILKRITKKQNINEIKVKGVLIGDLIYDTYLKKKYDIEPTINFRSQEFLLFLEEFLNLFFFWEKFIKQNKIDLVIISHTVYTLGLPARICNYLNGEAYLIEYDRLTRLDKKNFYKYSIAKNYKKIFSRFNNIEKEKKINEALIALKSRFSGSLKDIEYMTYSAFNKKKTKQNRLLKKKKTYKILIAPHDFVDAPHLNGKFIFPDMYEWLNFLCKLSKKTNFTWFIKTHPKMKEKYKSYQKYTRRVILNLLKDSNIKFIDPDTSHHSLIYKYNINCVLTVTGTIAHEYAYHGIKVINASKNNVHESYNFNFHAKNIIEYKKLIINKKLKPKININDLGSFYYMHYIYCDRNWFFKDLNLLIKKIGGYHNLNCYKIYDVWLKMFCKKENELINSKIDKFINSNKIVLDKKI